TVNIAATTPGATLDISSSASLYQIIGDLTGGADGIVNLGGKQLRFGNSVGTVTFNGVIQGGVLGSIVKKKFGTAVLTNINTYSGETIVYNGTLSIAGSGSIANSAALFINQNATFDISASTGAQTINTLLGRSGSTVNLGTNDL